MAEFRFHKNLCFLSYQFYKEPSCFALMQKTQQLPLSLDLKRRFYYCEIKYISAWVPLYVYASLDFMIEVDKLA